MSNTPILVTLTGPSCAGKSTLEKLLKERGFASLVSITTRQPRAGEVDGQSYYFVRREEFSALRAEGHMIESVEFNGNLYGISGFEVERVAALGKPIVVVCDPHGALQFRRYAEHRGWKIVSLFVNAPAETIARRFLDRYRQDIEAGNCRSLESYPSRLAEMMTTERGWVRAAGADSQYDVWFDNFDGDATEPTVNFIVNHVSRMEAPPLEEAA